jgi:aspartyl-tRNA(Asn)/glutamyl-tRNA(Gln) amidotransferase subunit C
MKITKEEARHLAALAGLILSDAELKSLTADLAGIVEYIGELGELDTTGVEPTYQVTGLQSVWRDDEVGAHLSREQLLELASVVKDNSVEVPQVL